MLSSFANYFLVLTIVINWNIIIKIAKDLLSSLNTFQVVILAVSLFAVSGFMFYLLQRFLRYRREEQLRKRLMRMQLWEIVKVDREKKKHRREREKIALGRQDI